MFNENLERVYEFYRKIQEKSNEAWEVFQKQLKKENGKIILTTSRKGKVVECELTEAELDYIKRQILGGNTLVGLEINCEDGKFLTLLYHQTAKKWVVL